MQNLHSQPLHLECTFSFWSRAVICFKITADSDYSHEVKRHLLLERKVMTNLDSILKTETLFCRKCPCSQSYGFSSSHVWMWELDNKEGWALKKGCFWTMVLEKTLESPLDSKEIKPVNPKGNQSWIFTGRTDAEAETPVLWPPDAKNWLENTVMLGRIEGGRRRGDRGWNGWMASLTWWTWVWASSGSRWWTGKPGVPQPMGSQRVGHDWTTKKSTDGRCFRGCGEKETLLHCWWEYKLEPLWKTVWRFLQKLKV